MFETAPVHGVRPSLITKVPTGIAGFDEVLGGGLPKGRTTVVCGGAGCGKTLFALEFLLRGAREMGEPGVLITFEESEEELVTNVASLGHDMGDLVQRGLLGVDHIRVEPTEMHQTGAFGLDGLLVRLAHAVDSVGATRVAFDSIEALFTGMSDTTALRGELQRLFRWLKDRELTAMVTAERGDGDLTRHGIEEYVSDCVLLLEHAMLGQRIATRRLRVVKYRGTSHGTDAYPFVISDDGIEVVPSSSMALAHAAPEDRVSTGVAELDAMLGGQGYHRGATVLITGQAGTGKSSLSIAFALAAAARGDRCLYLSMEESPEQIVRNMGSLGMAVRPALDSGHLRIEALRPTASGLEAHLAHFSRIVRSFSPDAVVIDPITALEIAGDHADVRLMLMRLVDFLKSRTITTVMTSLLNGVELAQDHDAAVSSLVDSWLLLRNVEHLDERNRALYVLKSRGTAHSNQVREFLLSDAGITLLPVEVVDGRVLTGAARAEAVMERISAEDDQRAERARLEAGLSTSQMVLEAQIAALRAQHQAEVDRVNQQITVQQQQLSRMREVQSDAAEARR